MAEPDDQTLRDTPTKIDADVGLRIRARRDETGLTQTGLADALGISFQQLSKVEAGKVCITLTRLAKIAQVTNTPISHFLGTSPAVDAASAAAPFIRWLDRYDTVMKRSQVNDDAVLLHIKGVTVSWGDLRRLRAAASQVSTDESKTLNKAAKKVAVSKTKRRNEDILNRVEASLPMDGSSRTAREIQGTLHLAHSTVWRALRKLVLRKRAKLEHVHGADRYSRVTRTAAESHNG